MLLLTKEHIIEDVSKIVGSKNVITHTKKLEGFSKDQSFTRPVMPICVVQPTCNEDVQEVVRLANRHHIPLTPRSSGTNNQGGAVPALNGLVVDLSKMNKILEIDDRAWMASIEAGVTFKQLQGEVKKHGLRVLTPVELPSEASVLSTYLDFAPLYAWTCYGEENLTTMSVVLPNGETLKTGTASMPTAEKPYCHAFGAPFAGLLSYVWFQSQGTLGIVTQSWVKLKARRESEKILFLPFSKVEDSFRVIYEIKRLRYEKEMVMMNKMDLALVLADRYPQEVISLRESLPPWTLIMTLRGREDEVEYQEEDLRELMSKFEVTISSELPEVPGSDNKLLEEIEDPEGWPKWSQFKGARNTIPFIASVEDIPVYNKAAFNLAERHGYPKEDIGCTAVPSDGNGRLHYAFSFARDLSDPRDTGRACSLYMSACRELAKLGAYFSRPYGIMVELMYNRAPTYHETIKKIKHIIDPNNIMNPGKLML